MSASGKLINDFMEINMQSKKAKLAALSGQNLIPEVYGAALTPVFYKSKMGPILKQYELEL